MSFRRNLIANYFGQFYVALVSIVVAPLYLKYMGAEAYGLVGFFLMLQAWFQLLDMGLAPAMAREVARFRGGANDSLSLNRLLSALEGVFVSVGVLAALILIAASHFVATGWLEVRQLDAGDVQGAIILMALIVALRLIGGLYRGVINGFERLVWLSGFNVSIATARFVLIIPYLAYIGATPGEFFGFQLLLAVVELAALVVHAHRIMPSASSRSAMWEWRPVGGVLKFALGVSFSGVVWVLITQVDKLILSMVLPLSEYGHFTLAVLAAGGISIVSAPISGALLPRLTKLNAECDQVALIRLYRNATQITALVAVPLTLFLVFFGEEVLWLWTGNVGIARQMAPVLALYALGNCVLALAAFPYYLQFAKGDLKLHLVGSGVFVAMLVPLLIWATKEYGMVGAGYAWLLSNLVIFFFWLPFVHRRLLRGLHLKWVMGDIVPIAVFPSLVGYFFSRIINLPTEKAMAFLYMLMMVVGLGLVALASSSWTRNSICDIWRKFTAQRAIR